MTKGQPWPSSSVHGLGLWSRVRVIHGLGLCYPWTRVGVWSRVRLSWTRVRLFSMV